MSSWLHYSCKNINEYSKNNFSFLIIFHFLTYLCMDTDILVWVYGVWQGKTFTANFETLDNSTSLDFFDPNYFPKEVLNRSELFKEGVCQKIFRPEDGDDPEPSPQFVFILCTNCEQIPPELFRVMYPIKVVDGKGSEKVVEGENELDVIAGLYGASEIIRYDLYIPEKNLVKI